MKPLMIHETEICSLSDLREHFDLTQVTAAFLNGELETWLRDCYYDRGPRREALWRTPRPPLWRASCAESWG